MMTKTPEHYRALPYTRLVRHIEEDSGETYFVAYVEELDGVEADGDTPNEALSNLADAFEDYLAAMIEWGDEIPEPIAWPESIGYTPAPEVTTVVQAAFVEMKAFVSEVPTRDDPRAQTGWIDVEEEDVGATAETGAVLAVA